MRHTFLRSFLTLVVLGVTLTSCGTFTNPDVNMGPRLGFRPDDPSFTVKPADPCQALTDYIKYAVNLNEAYRTRATQNRTWIYVAAITGLAVAAASGALAAASAVAAGTLALLAISGGFTAATFAVIDNSELANVYTVAANDISTALGNTQARITRCRSDEECRAQLAYLTGVVSNARNTLETARTSSAAGALARATAQKTLLDQEIEKAQAQLKAKEAAEKTETAKKDKAAADAAEKDAKVLKEAAAKDPNVKNAADAAEAKAKALRQEADRTAKAAQDAEAKLEADAAARAAATAPVTPPCLASEGRIVAIRPDGTVVVTNGKAALLEAVVDNVDLKHVSKEDLRIEIGGFSVPVDDKTLSPTEPNTWLIRFVPPPTRPSAGESQYTLRLVQKDKTLASSPTVRITYK
jgi:hypothetical protein